MMRKVLTAAALALASISAPALAQTPAAPADEAIDAARLAAARTVVEKVFPLGTYKRMMSGTLNIVMDSMMGSVGDMPLAQIAGLGGLDETAVKELGDAKLSEIMAIYDPHFRERTTLGMRAMMGAMTDMMGEFEPRMQAGLARAYARKFTAAQLADLNTFFATPSGSVYAAESMMLYMDPEVMTEMQAFMPEMMKRLPEFMKAMTDATKHLPAARKPDQLSAAEQERLAKLLGIKKNELRNPPVVEPVS